MKPKLADEYLQVDQMDWEDFEADFQTGGVQWKLLHVSPGDRFVDRHVPLPGRLDVRAHVHHGPAEGYIFKGEIEIRGGERAGGATAVRTVISTRPPVRYTTARR